MDESAVALPAPGEEDAADVDTSSARAKRNFLIGAGIFWFIYAVGAISWFAPLLSVVRGESQDLKPQPGISVLIGFVGVIIALILWLVPRRASGLGRRERRIAMFQFVALMLMPVLLVVLYAVLAAILAIFFAVIPSAA